MCVGRPSPPPGDCRQAAQGGGSAKLGSRWRSGAPFLDDVLRHRTAPPNVPANSRDVDFLAESAANVDDVYWLASVLGGRALIPHERALTALVGQAQKDAGPDEVINVDVIFKVFGAREGLRDRAVLAEVDGHAFKVMHQLDLLKSRLDNLYLLAEKQTPNGVMQLDRAVLVARAFLTDVAKQPAQDAMRPPVLMYIKLVEHLALSDAGRKVAERFGVHVATSCAKAAAATHAHVARVGDPLRRF